MARYGVALVRVLPDDVALAIFNARDERVRRDDAAVGERAVCGCQIGQRHLARPQRERRHAGSGELIPRRRA